MGRFRTHLPLMILTVVCIVALAVTPPLAQPLAYHGFADGRAWLGIPNFGDVMSNLPFLLVGIYGAIALWRMGAPSAPFLNREEWWAGVVACIGIALVALGSMYYHWNPSNTTLAWDRVPMTIGFMAIFAMIVMERLSVRFGWRVLWASLPLGLGSVAYWVLTDDLRPYVFVQFFPMLAIPLMIWRYPPRYGKVGYIGWMFFWYGLAKVAEHHDGEVLAWLHGAVSGHSLKHLFAAGATWAFVLYCLRRRPVDNHRNP